MSRNGSGTYTWPSGSFNPATSGASATPGDWNTGRADLETAVSASIANDGQTTITANLPMATFKFTGLGNGSAATDSVALGQLQSNAVNYALTTGTDTVLATLAPVITAYAIGQTYQFKKSAAANTTAVTLNINSVGAGAVTWPDGTALVSGDIPANAMFEVIVQATTPVFHLQTVSVFTGTGSVVKAISPTLTTASLGSSTATTQSASDNSTKIATTAYADAASAAASAATAPQGRLTLTSATPVLTATVSAATTIYYALYTGNKIPIYSGTAWSMTTFTELSNATAQSSTGSAGPAVVANNSNYDLFAWSNSGTLTLTRGPLWTSDTGRGTGAGTTQISRVLGIWSNTVAITNGPGAGLGTYVGTVRSNGSATIDWIIGATAAGGTAAVCGVFNAYNRVTLEGFVGDNTSSWTYTADTPRSANNSNTMRFSFVCGLQEDSFAAEYGAVFGSTGVSAVGYTGVGINSTSTFGGRVSAGWPITGGTAKSVIGSAATTPLGFNYLQGMESGGGSGTITWYGNSSPTGTARIQSGLTYRGRY